MCGEYKFHEAMPGKVGLFAQWVRDKDMYVTLDASLRPLYFYDEEEEGEGEEMFLFPYAPDQTNCPTELVESHSNDMETNHRINLDMKLR